MHRMLVAYGPVTNKEEKVASVKKIQSVHLSLTVCERVTTLAVNIVLGNVTVIAILKESASPLTWSVSRGAVSINAPQTLWAVDVMSRVNVMMRGVV